MALRVVEAVEESTDPVTARVGRVIEELSGLVREALDGVADDASEAQRVDRIAAFERLRGAVAAAQAAEVVGLARQRVEAELAAGLGAGVVVRPAPHVRRADLGCGVGAGR